MKTISMAALQQQVKTRKALLGMLDTPSEVEAMRNKGSGRTPEKRELLRQIEQRALAAGLRPIKAYF